jgi:hypothetical protein
MSNQRITRDGRVYLDSEHVGRVTRNGRKWYAQDAAGTQAGTSYASRHDAADAIIIARKPQPEPRIHTFSDSGEAYDASQSDDAIRDGDVLAVLSEGAVAVLCQAWPIVVASREPAVTGETTRFHTFEPGHGWDDPEYAGYAASVALAREWAGTYLGDEGWAAWHEDPKPEPLDDLAAEIEADWYEVQARPVVTVPALPDGEHEKITLLGPDPWGGTYTSLRSDPMVDRLLAEGHTVLRRWVVTWRDGKPVREVRELPTELDAPAACEDLGCVPGGPHFCEPFTVDGRPACGAPVDGGRCGRGPGHDGHPHIKEPGTEDQALGQAQHEVNQLYLRGQMTRDEYDQAIAAINAERRS